MSLVSGLPATTNTEQLELLDPTHHVMFSDTWGRAPAKEISFCDHTEPVRVGGE